MSDYAKLYKNEELGQVLITKETVPHPDLPDETCPGLEIRLLREGMHFGIVLPFPPNEEGYSERTNMFEGFTEELAFEAAEGILQRIVEMGEEAKERENEEPDGRTDR